MNEIRNSLRCALAVGLFLLLAMSSLGFVADSARAAYTPAWTAEAAMGDVRAQATVVQDGNGLVYVIGGFWNPGAAELTNASTYDPATGQWNDIAPLLTSTRGAAGACGPDGKIYVFGGGGSSTTITQIYDPVGDSWSYGTNMLVAVWQARAAVGYNGMIYVAGGYNSGSGDLATVQVYDPNADSWSYGLSMPIALSGGAFVAYNGGNLLYYFGGSSSSWFDSTDYAFEYDVYWGSWSSVSSMPVARSGHAAVVGLDNMIYVFGGAATGSNMGVSFATGNYYSPHDDSWGVLPNMTVEARHLGGATTADGKILALGGCNATDVFDHVESLQLVQVTATVSASSVPAGGAISVAFDTQFAYSVCRYSGVSMYLISDSDVVYKTYSGASPVGSQLTLQIDIPDIAPPGTYRLIIAEWVNIVDNGWIDVPNTEFALTILDAFTVDEQIAALEAEVSALQAALGTTDANMTALRAQVTALQGQVTALQTALVAMGAGQTAAMNALNATLADMQLQLDALQEKTDKVETKANNAGTYGMVTLILVIVVIALLAMMFMMSRKKP